MFIKGLGPSERSMRWYAMIAFNDAGNLREAALGLSMAMPGDAKSLSFVEDTAVPPEDDDVAAGGHGQHPPIGPPRDRRPPPRPLPRSPLPAPSAPEGVSGH